MTPAPYVSSPASVGEVVIQCLDGGWLFESKESS